MKLTEQEKKEAVALYVHLKEHAEVQNAPTNPCKPMCKICDKTATQILKESME